MNIRQVRRKIKSVSNVRKITRAMQMVSAVKMKKFQQAALDSQHYQRSLQNMISRISRKAQKNMSPLLTPPATGADRTLAIVVTSNKGLCGGFNVNLLRFLAKEVDFKKADFISIGKKGSQLISRFGGTLTADFSHSDSTDVSSAVFTLAKESFLQGKYEKVSVFYNKFVSPVVFMPTEDVLLPFSQAEKTPDANLTDYQYTVEPSPDEILNALFQSYIEEKIRYVVLQNEAGEHSARMMAMKNATDNASELIFNLTLLRNKIRQENITYELLDMISAGMAV